MKKILLSTVFAGMFALSACSGTASVSVAPNASTTNALAQIASFTVTDLQNADADAVAHNDVIAHACYPALIQFVQSSPLATPGTTVSGAFSAFQAARDVQQSVQGFQVPNYLKLGCAPLVMDVQQFLINLAALGAGAATGVPPLPAILVH